MAPFKNQKELYAYLIRGGVIEIERGSIVKLNEDGFVSVLHPNTNKFIRTNYYFDSPGQWYKHPRIKDEIGGIDKDDL